MLLAQAAARQASCRRRASGRIAALALFIAASVWLGTLAQKVVERSQFIQGYFQGNRGLGPWTIALTATVQSGGTFMGFPSLVYTHGWIVALWIGSYMVGPLTGFGLIGKRIAADFAADGRGDGARLVPGPLRQPRGRPGHVAADHRVHVDHDDRPVQGGGDRDEGGLAVSGTQRRLRPERQRRQMPTQPAGRVVASGGYQQAGYLAGLLIFSLTVVGYTLIGGFLAAVWTDLLQSVMMFIGVTILVVPGAAGDGGLEQATRQAVENVERRRWRSGNTPEEAGRCIAVCSRAGPASRTARRFCR